MYLARALAVCILVAQPLAAWQTLIYKVEPEYTEEARKARIEGAVALTIFVEEDGGVREARVERRLDKGLDQKAIEAVRQWRFRPRIKDGKPVRAQVTVEMNFRLLDR